MTVETVEITKNEYEILLNSAKNFDIIMDFIDKNGSVSDNDIFMDRYDAWKDLLDMELFKTLDAHLLKMIESEKDKPV